jgi:hypothetical protein
MDRLKQNPFLGFLVLFCAVLLVGGGFAIFSEAGRLAEEQSASELKNTELQQLQGHKPFPSKANVEATTSEAEEARAMLGKIADSFAVEIPAATPQTFQDELTKLVKDIAEKAVARNVLLPENFYLGFEQYETQLPSAKAAPPLARQLRTIHAVVAALLQSNIKSLGPVTRTPILAETKEGEPERTGSEAKQKETSAQGLEIAPFDISFNSDQSAFRLAFNRILELEPPVFVRLVAIENSAPMPPSKTADPAAAQPQAGTNATTTGIRPVVGRETVDVDLKMASVVSPAPPSH